MRRLLFILALLGVCGNAHGQDCRYTHALPQPTETYHRIELPDLALQSDPEPSDLRVYGRTASGDTLEVPYVWEPYRQNPPRVALELSSPGKVDGSFRYTLELPGAGALDELVLDVAQTSFDARVLLEGANKLRDWQTILSDARILGFDGQQDRYVYTTVRFPRSTFAYYRITVSGMRQLTLRGVSAASSATEPARKRFASQLSPTARAKPKQSEFDVVLPTERLVDQVTFYVAGSGPYARYVEITALRDSVNLANERYRTERLGSAGMMLSSGRSNTLEFERPVPTKHLRVVIRNGDDRALILDSVALAGPRRFVDARFGGGEEFWLAYGCAGVDAPSYDLKRQVAQIPDSLPVLRVGKQQVHAGVGVGAGGWQWSELWLWLALGVAAGVILLFSFRLLRG